MYHALVIIITLTAAFIILIRRLPAATRFNDQEPHEQKSPRPATAQRSWSLPTAKLPSLKKPAWLERRPTSIAERKSREIAVPAPISTTIETPPSLPSTPTAIPKPAPDRPSWSLPKMTGPRWPSFKRNDLSEQTEAAKVPKQPAEPATDFWQGANLPPVAPEKIPSSSLKKEDVKSRNLFQEAEDAFAIKDYRKAERLYLRLATSHPKDPKIYGRLGIIYLEQKNYEDARDALQAALKLEPNVASRHFNLALTYLQLGSRAKAISSMEAALKYDPSNRKYRKMLDEILANRA